MRSGEAEHFFFAATTKVPETGARLVGLCEGDVLRRSFSFPAQTNATTGAKMAYHGTEKPALWGDESPLPWPAAGTVLPPPALAGAAAAAEDDRSAAELLSEMPRKRKRRETIPAANRRLAGVPRDAPEAIAVRCGDLEGTLKARRRPRRDSTRVGLL